MSRCFPFPPPGYEKKTRKEDIDLLKKEKEREKKHKKEKKDKEKREGKERREKDKSDGKHKERKEKKEKNRDRKKDKDREKDKDKNSNLDEKRSPRNSDSHIGEKVSNEKGIPGQSEGHNGEKVSDEKRRLPGRFDGHNGERISNEKIPPLQSKAHGRDNFFPKEDKQRNNVMNERKSAGQVAGNNGGKVSRSIPLAEAAQVSKFVQEFNRRVRDETKGTENGYVNKFTGADQKRDDGILESVFKATGNGVEGNGKKKDKRGDDRKIGGEGIWDDTRFSGNSTVQNLTKVFQTKVEGITRPFEKNGERRMEGKEQTEEMGGDDDKRRDKHKNKDRERKSQGKDKDREKERKKEENAKEKKENKIMEEDKVKESIKNDIIGNCDVKAPNHFDNTNKSAATEGNLRKRKDCETNGFLHANESRPNKLLKPTTSSRSLSKNGKILEPCQTSIPFNSDGHGVASNSKVDSENPKVNGTIEAQPFPVSLAKSALPTPEAIQIGEASRKSPHPDSKFLSQILSVPNMEECSDFDAQDWLFSCNGFLSKKSKIESLQDDETPLVWSEARRIESADVYALPYVIPY